MVDKTILSCGVDIPFPEAQLTIHPPKIKEIAMIGEKDFFIGCEILNIQKKDFESQGKNVSENINNFDILMSIMNDKSKDTLEQRKSVKKVLNLIFPIYEIFYMENQFLLVLNEQTLTINKDNFETFQKILIDLFMLNKRNKDEAAYNPANSKAAAIMDKIYKGRKKVAEEKGQSNEEFYILGKYADILSIGLQLDRNIFNEYTVWQLYSAFDKFMSKYNWDIVMNCKLAGATKVEDVKNWMD